MSEHGAMFKFYLMRLTGKKEAVVGRKGSLQRG